jgi:putative transposase
MARLPRLVIPQQLHHIIQSGIDAKRIFVDDEDYSAFLSWMGEASRLFKVAIHSYVLMPDHLHLLATPSDEIGLSKMMQWIGRHYVPYFNGKYQRQGTLWQGLYKATVMEAQPYLLRCSLYIESNPVRSGLVAEVLDYPWTSYQHHIGLKTNPLVTDHPVYWAMGNTPFQREAAYKEMMIHGLSATETQALTAATLKAWMLGTVAFKAEMMKLTERRVEPIKRGRPRKQVEKI